MTRDLFGLLAPEATDAAPPVFDCALEHERLEFRDPFRIARAEPDQQVTTVIVEAISAERADASQLAFGEAFPVAYYGETVETIEAVVPVLHDAVNRLGAPPGDVAAARAWLERAAAAMDAAIGHHGGAKCGLDIALHDLVGQQLGVPLYELLEMSPELPPTDFSLGLDEPAVVADRAKRAAHFPALKIKVGGPSDIETLEAVRAVYSGPLRVDANTGWAPDQAARIIPELVRLGVELIEQPFAAHRLAELRWLQEHSELPIVADESAVTEDDLANLAGVAGVNVKLTKVGGVGPAARMIRRARELGFKVMLGCMEETSVGIAAAAAVASLADWVDLDGNLLIANDPFTGLELASDCRWRLPMTAGLGVRRRDG
jgi:L-alanine-DL-glutamate epimerase-like enolase superfamily enzyme